MRMLPRAEPATPDSCTTEASVAVAKTVCVPLPSAATGVTLQAPVALAGLRARRLPRLGAVLTFVFWVLGGFAVRGILADTGLPRDAVTCVVEAPYGAYPCCCDDRYTYDLDFVGDYYAASADPAGFARYLDEWVFGLADHDAFLQKVGVDRLLAITTKGAL